MNTVVEVIDCSALVLPGVGGRYTAVPNWVPNTIERLGQCLTKSQGHPDGITVIGEWAGVDHAASEPVVTDLGSYLGANYHGIYGALGLKPPHNLPTGPPVLVPESLGHAVIRYVVGQSIAADPGYDIVPVTLIEICCPLSDQERANLLQTATQGRLAVVATHAPEGVIAQGMSQGRQDVQREIDKIILGILNGW